MSSNLAHPLINPSFFAPNPLKPKLIKRELELTRVDMGSRLAK